MSSKPAFDALAPTYDADFTQTHIARWLRDRVHDRLAAHFHAGESVLELGCGTGEDALRLAQRGVSVLATDASPAMLDAARAKTTDEPLVRVERLDLQALKLADTVGDDLCVVPLGAHAGAPLQLVTMQFDGAFSNFGALNCLSDWRPLAAWLSERIKPGGIAAFGVMSPLCLWEMLWHGLHGDFRTATRRLRKSAPFQPDGSAEPIAIHYPTIRRLTRDFAPYFERIHAHPLGVFLPPSDVYGVIEKRPRLLRTLLKLEQHFGDDRKLALFADHYWIEFRRIST